MLTYASEHGVAGHKTPKDHWSSETYASAAGFVPKLTEKVLAYLDPQPNDRILDVGCGDGKFTSNFIDKVAEVYGIDASANFIREAQVAYASHAKGVSTKTTFSVVDCRYLENDERSIKGKWDKIVSNAALHWILRDASTRMNTLTAIFDSLRPDGKFVFEMGGAGNCAEVSAALISTLIHVAGFSAQAAQEASPWFFPDEAWMRKALESIGFHVQVLELQYRPTRFQPKVEGMQGTAMAGGIEGWLRLMIGSVLYEVEEQKGIEIKEQVVQSMCDSLEGVVGGAGRGDGSEYLGYVRLRGIAVRPES